MLLLAEGLFRLDVVVAGDTLRTVVRNLSSGPLEMQSGARRRDPVAVGFGEVDRYEPGSTSLEFSLGAGADRVTVEVTIGTLQVPDRGTVRVTGQAIVRRR